MPNSKPNGASTTKELSADQQLEQEKQSRERRQFREDILLDFAAFESSIARIQFLLKSNERERERYAAEKVKIQETAQAVRESAAQLHAQLAEAQKTLALRKSWDELTEKITNNRMLRPRQDQEANLARLNSEIAELEREREQYAQTWAERREQFGRIIKEGMELRRLIRDEKEEVERREGMEEREAGEEGEVETQTREGSVAGTPRRNRDGDTPMHRDHNNDVHNEPPSDHLAVIETHTPLGRSPSRDPTPLPLPELKETVDEPEDGEAREEDVVMTDQGEIDEGDEEGLLTEPIRDDSRMDSAALSTSPGKSPTPGVGLIDGDKDREVGEVLDSVDGEGKMDTTG